MDLARLRFGDWVMGIGGLAVLLVMFLDWYEVPTTADRRGRQFNAWESFAVNDVILALAAVMAIAAFVAHRDAADRGRAARARLAHRLVAILALVLVDDPRDLAARRLADGPVDTARETGRLARPRRDDACSSAAAWRASATSGCRSPEHPVEPRLVQP